MPAFQSVEGQKRPIFAFHQIRGTSFHLFYSLLSHTLSLPMYNQSLNHIGSDPLRLNAGIVRGNEMEQA